MSLKEKLRGCSLRYKILILLLSALFVLFLAEIFSLFLVSRSYERKLYRSVASSLSSSSTQISEELERVNTMVDTMLVNTTIQSSLFSALKSTYISERQSWLSQAYSALCDSYFVFDHDYISWVTIVQNEDRISTSNRDFQTLPQELTNQLITDAELADGKTTIVTDYSTSYGLFIVKELKKIDGLDLTPLGTLIINIDMGRLLALATIQNLEYKDISCFLYDQDRLVYNYSPFSDEEALEINRQLSHSYSVVSLENDRLFAVRGTIPLYGWSYICSTDYRSIYHAITLSSQSFCVITVLTMIVVFLFVARMISSLFSHFDRLIENMRQFGEGNYQIEPAPASYPTDEIGLLYQNFDAMVEKIETLIEENYVNELLKKEAQIKALESQIDPHFLYNTLDSINWRARLIKSDEISQITTSLGTLLRISLSKDTDGFCLQQELTLVENYIAIQKIRYHDRLDFSIQIPEQYWSVSIPKFTLQPLLENAIRYGLEESSETCRITISSKWEEGILILRVTNTGSSFEEGLLEKLEEGTVQPHGFGIGVLNIHKRIQLTYGKQYGLRLYTLEDEDTCEEYAVAEVHIPCSLKEERTNLC